MAPSLGLSLIVKNAAATLERCLSPFRGIADEIVVAETGSTDGTRAILERFGARVVDFAWIDDFAAARNAALDAGTADWFLSIDADEYVSSADAQQLAELTRTDALDAYLIDTINYVTEADDATVPTEGNDRAIAPFFFVSAKIRLFRRGPRWDGRVHELLDMDVRRLKYRVGKSSILIRHDGLLGGHRGGKYLALCERAYAEGGAHAGIITVLGLEAVKRGDAKLAEKLLREAIAKERGFANPVMWLGKVLHATKRSDEAIRLLQEGMKNCMDAAPLLATLIDIHTDLGEKQCADVMIELGRKLYPGNPYVAHASRKRV